MSALLGIMAAAGGDRATSAEMELMLPSEVRGWKAQMPDGIYSSETLYQLIDGSAEVYRSFNVRTVFSRRYAKENAPDIIVDIFDMGSSKDAYGAFHHDMREGKDAGIGQESEMIGNSLSFWKARFFSSIISLDENDEVSLAMRDLGESIVAAIPRPGSTPGLLTLLPSKGLMASQVHYFHDWPVLNRHLSLTGENPLLLDRRTEGIVARYRARSPGMESAPVPYSLLIVRYPEAASAKRAFRTFRKGYLPATDRRGVGRMDKGGWSGIRLIGRVLMAVLGAQEREEAARRLDEVETALTGPAAPLVPEGRK